MSIGNAVFHVGYVEYVKKTQMTYFILAVVMLAAGVMVMLAMWAICEKLQKRAQAEKGGTFNIK